MKRNALLGTVLALLALGCNSQRPEERKMPPSAAGSVAAPPGSTPPSAPPTTGSAGPAPGSAAGSAAPEAKGTGFALFDEALAGARPWVASDDKAGVVELYAVDDLSGQTKGKLSVDRRCGADAAKAVEAVGKRMAERAKTGHEAPRCKEDGGTMTCFQPGIAEGDVGLEIQYAKTGDAWRLVGVKTYGVGVTMEKELTKYTALLKDRCK